MEQSLDRLSPLYRYKLGDGIDRRGLWATLRSYDDTELGWICTHILAATALAHIVHLSGGTPWGAWLLGGGVGFTHEVYDWVIGYRRPWDTVIDWFEWFLGGLPYVLLLVWAGLW